MTLHTRDGRMDGKSAYGIRPSASSNKTPVVHSHKVKASEYNPDGFEWLYKGVAVKLLPSSGYTDAPSNPKVGTQYECPGVVTGIHDPASDHPEHRPVSVQWQNGEHNSYFFEDIGPSRKNVHPKAKERKKKKGKLFNIDNVVLLKPGFYPPGIENPSIGSDFQCSGLVIEAHHKSSEVVLKIRWNNGMRNGYSVSYKAEKKPELSSLVEIEDKETLKAMVMESPNLAYKLTKVNQKDDYGVLGLLRKAAGIEEPDPDPWMKRFIEKQEGKYVETEHHYVHLDIHDGTTGWTISDEFLSTNEDDENPEGN